MTLAIEWTGKSCGVALFQCNINLCENRAICMQTNPNKSVEELPQNDRILCYCLPDFYGNKCQHKYNDCYSYPCLNDGICIDGIDSYTCNCSKGYIGTNCQIDCRNPLNEKICLTPTTATIDLSTSSHELTPSVDISSTFESSFETITSVYPSIYWSSIEVISSETPFLNISDIIYSTFTTIMTTPFPQITVSPIEPIPESSPTIGPIVKPFPTASSETKIFIPRFNGYNSSVIYHLKRSKRDFVSILLSLKSDENTTGVVVPVLYSKSRHNHELLIYIKNNLLKLLIFKGLKQILQIDTKFKITAKVFNKIDVKLWVTTSDKRLNFMLKLNESEKTGGYQEISEIDSHELCSFDSYYFGTIPSKLDKLFPKNETKLFSGCIQNVFINKYELFLSDAIKVTDVSECVTNLRDICAQNPCRNGGSCQTDGQQWQCLCPEGYAGDLCETSYCSEGLCRNDGVCLLPDEHNYLCVCAYGWTGNNCELGKY